MSSNNNNETTQGDIEITRNDDKSNDDLDSENNENSQLHSREVSELSEVSASSSSVLFWEIFEQLEKQHPECMVRESMLRRDLIASGKFDAGLAVLAVNEAVDTCKLRRMEFDVLCRRV